MVKLLFCLMIFALAVPAQTLINGARTVNGSVNYCEDAGATDTYACTITGLVSYVTGACYEFKANTANTGAASINFTSLGAKTIVKVGGGVSTTLSDNDIRVGQIVKVCYDGTNMQMQSQLGNAPVGTGTVTEVTGTANEITVADGTTTPALTLASTFDISGKTSTKPVKSGTSAPGTCSVGELFFDTDATAGSNLQACTASNTWTTISGTSSGTVSISDTYANIVATTCDASIDGTIGTPTDSVYDYLRCDGAGNWEHYFQGVKMTPPSTSTLSTDVNSPTKATTQGGVYVGGPASTLNVRGIFQAVPATPYTVETAFIVNWIANASYKSGAGISFRASGSGNMSLFMQGNLDTQVVQYLDPTTYNSLVRSGTSFGPLARVVWLRMSDDGSTRRFYQSSNGQRWVEIVSSQGSTAFITANQIGLAMYNEDGNFEAGAFFIHYRVF